MIRFKTKSGSTYEIDEAAQTFRQVEGSGPERRKQWRGYCAKHGPEVGRKCVISIDEHFTVLTSLVVEVSVSVEGGAS